LTVAAFGKRCLRQLEDPLLTKRLWPAWLSAAAQPSPAAASAALRKVALSLPSARLSLLRVLLKHLSVVVGASAKNRMTSLNLGVVFGPTLLSCEDIQEVMMHAKDANRVVSLLIDMTVAGERFESGSSAAGGAPGAAASPSRALPIASRSEAAHGAPTAFSSSSSVSGATDLRQPVAPVASGRGVDASATPLAGSVAPVGSAPIRSRPGEALPLPSAVEPAGTTSSRAAAASNSAVASAPVRAAVAKKVSGSLYIELPLVGLLFAASAQALEATPGVRECAVKYLFVVRLMLLFLCVSGSRHGWCLSRGR